MLILSHPSCVLHDPGACHAESPQRLKAVLDALHAMDQGRMHWAEAPSAVREQLLRVHQPRLVEQVLDGPDEYPRQLDPDTVMSPGSIQAALHAAGAVIAGVDTVLGDESLASTRQAFCAVRPPGHHATASEAMGFCLFNNIAVGAAHALHAHGLSRVAVVDFDVHHGNGSQDIFQNDPRVLFLSSHQSPLYPGTGAESEHGVGNVINVKLPAGSGGRDFREAWENRLLARLDAFAPQLILVSAGFDAHRLEPLAGLDLEFSDYAWLGRRLRQLADRHCNGRLVASLEGGYSLGALGGCVQAFVEAMMQAN